MSWLVTSIVLSLVLTVFLNVGLRLFRGNNRHRGASPATEVGWLTADERRPSDRRVRVWVPWKAMVVGSVILTIVVNFLLWIA